LRAVAGSRVELLDWRAHLRYRTIFCVSGVTSGEDEGGDQVLHRGLLAQTAVISKCPFLELCLVGGGLWEGAVIYAGGNRGAGGVCTGPGAGAACVGAPGPLGLLGPLRLGCVWVWEAGSGLCGRYVRWIEPLGVLRDMSVGSGPRWSGVAWVVLRKGAGSGLGGLERGGGWRATGFQAKRDGHRAPRGGVALLA
jgi:hypothetical protein